MPIFVARLSDGDSLIGEAETLQDVQKNFLKRWEHEYTQELEKPNILSIRELPKNEFISRWKLTKFQMNTENKACGGWPKGSLGYNECLNIHEKEYPLVEEALQAFDDAEDSAEALKRIKAAAIIEKYKKKL